MELRKDNQPPDIEAGAGGVGVPLAHRSEGRALLQRAEDLQHIGHGGLEQMEFCNTR